MEWYEDARISRRCRFGKIEISTVHVGFKPSSSKVPGACLHSGAHRIVIGMKQAGVYKRQVGESAAFSNIAEGNIKRVKFGSSDHPREGSLHVQIPILEDIVVIFDA